MFIGSYFLLDSICQTMSHGHTQLQGRLKNISTDYVVEDSKGERRWKQLVSGLSITVCCKYFFLKLFSLQTPKFGGVFFLYVIELLELYDNIVVLL